MPAAALVQAPRCTAAFRPASRPTRAARAPVMAVHSHQTVAERAGAMATKLLGTAAAAAGASPPPPLLPSTLEPLPLPGPLLQLQLHLIASILAVLLAGGPALAREKVRRCCCIVDAGLVQHAFPWAVPSSSNPTPPHYLQLVPATCSTSACHLVPHPAAHPSLPAIAATPLHQPHLPIFTLSPRLPSSPPAASSSAIQSRSSS